MMKECPKWVSWVILIIGVVYLLKELNITTIPYLSALSWYTVAFVLAGLAGSFGSK